MRIVLAPIRYFRHRRAVKTRLMEIFMLGS